MRAMRGAESLVEVSNSKAALLKGSGVPKPPRRVGNDSNLCSIGTHGTWPVRAGRNLCWMASCNGWRSKPMFGTVRSRYVHLLTRPSVKAEYAECGLVSAILDGQSICFVHSFTYAPTNCPKAAPRCCFTLGSYLHTGAGKMLDLLDSEPCFVLIHNIAKFRA